MNGNYLYHDRRLESEKDRSMRRTNPISCDVTPSYISVCLGVLAVLDES